MARKLQITGDGGLTIPTAAVDDEACSSASGKEIRLTAQRHLHIKGTNFGSVIAGTPATAEVMIHRAATSGTLRNFRALLTLDGSSTSVAYDLKKNGTTVLSGAVTLTHSSGDGVAVSGTISSATYSAGDRFTISQTVSSSTGAQGPWAEAEFDETAA